MKCNTNILECLATGIGNRQSYGEDVRNFCISVNNISPAAYRMLRKKFNENVPAPVTIRAWHSNADINTKPGILNQSIEVLRRKVAEKAEKNEKLIGALLFDEMKIKKMVQRVNNQMIGFENLPGIDPKDAKIATDALVFMFSAINDNFKLPLAYYFIASTEAAPKTTVMQTLIKRLLEIGVLLVSVTFDGHRSNPAACENLGANLKVLKNSFKPSFDIEGSTINILFDPSHVIKLLRGCLAKNKLYDADNNLIKWIYLERLVRFVKRRNFGSMHKLTQAHIDFHSNPMNVRLAVETLSDSTADAIEFLMNRGHSEFAGAEPLIRYIRICNKWFDIFNSAKSQKHKQNPFKNMMSEENVSQIFEFFDEAVMYVEGLQCRNDSGKKVALCESTLKTGFQGIIVNIRSITAMYQTLVGGKYISHLPTRKISQDHLEIHFGDLRSFKNGGNNNNPNCLQFNAAMRKLLANTTLVNSGRGNCLIDDEISNQSYSNITTVSFHRQKPAEIESQSFIPEDVDEVLKDLSDINEKSSKSQITDLSDISLAYIASTIEIKFENSKKFDHEWCKDVFEYNDKVHRAFTSTSHTREACQSTFDICRAADYFLKIEILKGQYSPELIRHCIISSLDIHELFPNSDFVDEKFKKEFIDGILFLYIRYKLNYIAKTVSINEFQENMRRRLHRMIINYNQ